jgi:hypothetical protein
MFSGIAQVSPSGLSVILVSSRVSSCVCDCGGHKKGCRLLFANHIGQNVIRKEGKKE